MAKHLEDQKRPSCIPAGRAFLRSEAWQSGLLHRAYPSADVWASNPLTASRELVLACFDRRWPVLNFEVAYFGAGPQTFAKYTNTARLAGR